MLLFITLLLKLLPLYLNIVLGFIAGKWLGVTREIIGRLMFYLINPIVLFNGILYTRIDAAVLSLPLIVLLISSGLCLGFYTLAKRFWTDSTSNLVGFSAGIGNTGYFGLPLALLLLNNQGEGVYMMAMMGLALYENTIGFYVFSKGKYAPAVCLKKLMMLPTLYAFFAALVLNYLEIPVPEVFSDFMCHIKGTYIVLGMMIIGVGLGGMMNFKLDKLFVAMTFFAKFVAWPMCTLLLIFIDKVALGLFNADIYHALILISIVPLAVNSVVLATVLKAHPEKAAIAVILSTLFALVYVPLMVIFFMPEVAASFEAMYC